MRSNKATLIGIPVPVVVPPRDLATTPPEPRPASVMPAIPTVPPVPPSVAPSEASATPNVAPSAASITPKPSSASTQDSEDRGRAKSKKEKRPFSDTRADSPQAKGPSIRVSVPPEGSSSSSRLLMVALVIAALIMGARWYYKSIEASAPPAAPPVAEAPARLPDTTPAEAAKPPATEQAEPAPAPSAAASVAAVAADAPAPEPAPSASAAPAASAALEAGSTTADGKRVVIVKLSPSHARLYRKGKPVGSSPVTLELAPGEKRSFEVGAPGWVTRRLVVDGSKPEIFIGLKPSGK